MRLRKLKKNKTGGRQIDTRDTRKNEFFKAVNSGIESRDELVNIFGQQMCSTFYILALRKSKNFIPKKLYKIQKNNVVKI